MNQTEAYHLYPEVAELLRDFQGLMKDLYAAHIDPTKLINKALCREIHQDLSKLLAMQPKNCCIIRGDGDAEIWETGKDPEGRLEELMERAQSCSAYRY